MSLPSSHTSEPSILPLPHSIVDEQAPPCFGHLELGSTLQAPEQPSPGTELPSSQSSPTST